MRTALVAAVAGLAWTAHAEEAPFRAAELSDVAGHIYFNPATGQTIRTMFDHATRGQDEEPLWANDRDEECDIGGIAYYSIRDSATNQNTWWLDWGDVESNSVVDSMTFLYHTTVQDPESDGVDGFDLIVSFFDGVDTDQIPGGLEPFISYAVGGIPGSSSGVAAWLITVDLSGALQFEIGDSDGIDRSGHGFYSGGQGVDLDGDGLSDFAYGFNFRHPVGETEGFSGIGTSGPSDKAPGDVDMAAHFNADWGEFDRYFDFGGHRCPPGWVPWTSAYLVLYEGPGCCPADANCDGALDFFDIQTWLAWFAAQDRRADMNGDGLFDFFDAQTYLTLFAAGCP